MIIGLTGGIATGKSTVSNYLQDKYLLPVIDADIIAREAVMINSPIYWAIVDRFSEDILWDHGDINRVKLGDIVFNNQAEKTWLEKQIHPWVRQEIINRVKELKESIIVVVIPLIFEAKMTDLVDKIWVVICEEEKQLKRLMMRNNLTEKEAIIRINSQLPLSEKIKLAHETIDNNDTLENLYQQIDRIMAKYLHLNVPW